MLTATPIADAEAGELVPGSNPYPLGFLIHKLKNPVVSSTFVIFNARTCNRDCDFCYIKNMNWGQQSFDYAEIDKVFQENENVTVGFAGGEPFMDREAMAAFGYAVSKYHSRIRNVQIMSNMDYYPRVREWLDMLPIKVTITTNARNRYFFESDEHVTIWNGIFLDEFLGVEKYPLGPKYQYAFAMKNPTFFNDMGSEGTNFDIEDVKRKLQVMHAGGSYVTILSTGDFVEYTNIRNMFMDKQYQYTRKINFPSGWKEEYQDLNETCRKCGKETDDCKIAIAANSCPRLHKECFHCDKVNVCSTFRIPERIFMKDRYPDCSKLKAVMDLGQQYRALYYRDQQNERASHVSSLPVFPAT